MTDTATKTRDGALREPEQHLPSDLPSQLDQREPKVARTIGLVGGSVLAFGLGMTLWNTFQGTEGARFIFNATLVRLWCVLGVAGLLYHAFQDRDLAVRRGYGLVGYVLLFFGAVLTTYLVTGIGVTLAHSAGLAPEWMTPTVWGAVKGGSMGLVMLAFSTLPFVREDVPGESTGSGWKGALAGFFGFFPRWWKGLMTSSRIQQVTVVAVAVTAGALIAGLYLQSYNLLPYALGTLALGFVFLLPYGANETDTTWRDGAVYVLGAIGAMAALTTLATGFSDLGLKESLVLPYGVFAGLLIGFPFLCAFVGLEGSDSNLGYRSAQAVGLAGLLIFGVGLVRSLIPPIAREFFEVTSFNSFLLPSGFFLMTVGALYFLLGATLASDNRFLVMTRRELASLFFSPIAYVVLAGMACMGWLAFVFFLSMVAPEASVMGQQSRPVPEPIIRYFFLGFVALVCLIAAVPMLTMRLLSEEQRTGTLEVLLVAPVTETQIVLSKFFAAWLFFMLAWTLWIFFPLALRLIGEEPFDYRPMLSFYVGMAAMGTGFLSMGLFFSSVTKNQVIALFLTLAVMILLTVLVIFMFYAMDDPAASQTKKDALGYVSYYHHIDEFVQGRVHPRFILFHVSLAVFWLYLTVKVLEARKWR